MFTIPILTRQTCDHWYNSLFPIAFATIYCIITGEANLLCKKRNTYPKVCTVESWASLQVNNKVSFFNRRGLKGVSWQQISFQIYPESVLTKWLQGWYPHVYADRRNISLHGLLSPWLREIVSCTVQFDSGGSPCSPYEPGSKNHDTNLKAWKLS